MSKQLIIEKIISNIKAKQATGGYGVNDAALENYKHMIESYDDEVLDKLLESTKGKPGDDWYYSIDDDDDDLDEDANEDEPFRIWIVRKEFWDKNHYFEDQSLGDAVKLPKGFYECQESCYEYEGSKKGGIKVLKQMGFTALPPGAAN